MPFYASNLSILIGNRMMVDGGNFNPHSAFRSSIWIHVNWSEAISDPDLLPFCTIHRLRAHLVVPWVVVWQWDRYHDPHSPDLVVLEGPWNDRIISTEPGLISTALKEPWDQWSSAYTQFLVLIILWFNAHDTHISKKKSGLSSRLHFPWYIFDVLVTSSWHLLDLSKADMRE